MAKNTPENFSRQEISRLVHYVGIPRITKKAIEDVNTIATAYLTDIIDKVFTESQQQVGRKFIQLTDVERVVDIPVEETGGHVLLHSKFDKLVRIIFKKIASYSVRIAYRAMELMKVAIEKFIIQLLYEAKEIMQKDNLHTITTNIIKVVAQLRMKEPSDEEIMDFLMQKSEFTTKEQVIIAMAKEK